MGKQVLNRSKLLPDRPNGFRLLTFFALAAFTVTLFGVPFEEARADGPKIQIVTAKQPPQIEQLAAHEMAAQLTKLFDARVSIVDGARDSEELVIVLASQPALKGFSNLKLELPSLNDQDHAIKSGQLGNKSALIVTGGSPRSTLWAAYELGWRYGVRYFLFGDLYPADAGAFSTQGHDLLLRPAVAKRTWYALFPSPAGPESWGLEEHRKVLGQLAKLKYTSAIIRASDLKGGELVSGPGYSVSGDTVGRSAFGGAKVFGNPDLRTAQSPADRMNALEKMAASLITEAHRFGISTKMDKKTAEQIKQSDNWRLPGNSVLPVTRLGAFSERLRSHRADENLILSIGNPGDAAPEVIFLSRFAFQPTLDVAVHEAALLDPVSGEGVAERVIKGLKLAELATNVLMKNDPTLGSLNRDTISRAYASQEPVPAWWGEVRDHYLNAMNEMYRANTRAREGGRKYTLYFARRFEFGFEFMNAMEAVRKSGLAKQAKKKDEQVAELEKALDSITGASDALAAVASSNSDLGAIALMNEYVYRPVQKLLEQADAE